MRLKKRPLAIFTHYTSRFQGKLMFQKHQADHQTALLPAFCEDLDLDGS